MLAPVVVLWVAVGGALGAVLRHAADGAAQRWSPRVAELGVLGVNLVASAVLGFLAGGEVLLGSVPGEGPMAPTLTASRILGVDWWLLGAGLAGALSTFSTAVVQVARRVRAGEWGTALALAGVTWVVCAGAARLGAELGVVLA
ncbi:fluoride efflux transporter FluC [Kytococcus sedentarius]|uniref:Fluoride-specific ion channel n=1 Tax=Kytococcus sedentarius (strain ATCC 14392 / DSM 20547 / JCM 11482 / CCUG 33030 / NBRC 15357 / NCTC 11040 / CCM 314 / 541) TaxID=478801 RepID=C7NFB3_KYTSD|nr:CrcB family protein [Kytococcus sedentarius]ACV07366.1 Integral membrane protein possibly involved in chromosome condensation [Kytococcus sedentarius DSM 20547]STX13790.1 camphor resistance protein CrcB [Kytococcus sedentarius]